MTSCTYDMPRSACTVALETYHGASTIILRILDECAFSLLLHRSSLIYFQRSYAGGKFTRTEDFSSVRLPSGGAIYPGSQCKWVLCIGVWIARPV
jgi:hypothetical protein